jgi:hypothetical protein
MPTTNIETGIYKLLMVSDLALQYQNPIGRPQVNILTVTEEVAEGETAVFAIQRSGLTTTACSVNYSVTDPSSPPVFVGTPAGTISFTSGQLSQNLNLATRVTAGTQPLRTASVTLLNPVGCDVSIPNTAMVDCKDNSGFPNGFLHEFAIRMPVRYSGASTPIFNSMLPFVYQHTVLRANAEFGSLPLAARFEFEDGTQIPHINLMHDGVNGILCSLVLIPGMRDLNAPTNLRLYVGRQDNTTDWQYPASFREVGWQAVFAGASRTERLGQTARDLTLGTDLTADVLGSFPAANFDGVDDYIYGNTSALYLNGLSEFSMFAWFKSDVVAQSRELFNVCQPATRTNGEITMRLSSDNTKFVAGARFGPPSTTATNWWNLPIRSGRRWAGGIAYWHHTDTTHPTAYADEEADVALIDSGTGSSKGADRGNVSTWTRLIGGAVGSALTSIDTQFDWRQNIDFGFGNVVHHLPTGSAYPDGSGWLVWVIETIPASESTDGSSEAAADSSIWDEIINGDHDTKYVEFGKRIVQKMAEVGHPLKRLILDANHEMNQSNHYRVWPGTRTKYTNAMTRTITKIRAGADQVQAGAGAILKFMHRPAYRPDTGYTKIGPYNSYIPDGIDILSLSMHPRNDCNTSAKIDQLFNGTLNSEYYGISGSDSLLAAATALNLPIAFPEWSPVIGPTDACPVANDFVTKFYHLVLVPNREKLVCDGVFNENIRDVNAYLGGDAAGEAQWAAMVATRKALWKQPITGDARGCILTSPGGIIDDKSHAVAASLRAGTKGWMAIDGLDVTVDSNADPIADEVTNVTGVLEYGRGNRGTFAGYFDGLISVFGLVDYALPAVELRELTQAFKDQNKIYGVGAPRTIDETEASVIAQPVYAADVPSGVQASIDVVTPAYNLTGAHLVLGSLSVKVGSFTNVAVDTTGKKINFTPAASMEGTEGAIEFGLTMDDGRKSISRLYPTIKVTESDSGTPKYPPTFSASKQRWIGGGGPSGSIAHGAGRNGLLDALSVVNAGEEIVLGNETYTGDYTLIRAGTATQKIVIRSRSHLQSIMSGRFFVGSTLTNAQHTWLSGIRFTYQRNDDAGADEFYPIVIDSSNSWVTNCWFSAVWSGIRYVFRTGLTGCKLTYCTFESGWPQSNKHNTMVMLHSIPNSSPPPSNFEWAYNYLLDNVSLSAGGGNERHAFSVQPSQPASASSHGDRSFNIHHNFTRGNFARHMYSKRHCTMAYNVADGYGSGQFGFRHGYWTPTKGNGGLIEGNLVIGLYMILNGSGAVVRGNRQQSSGNDLKLFAGSTVFPENNAASNTIICDHVGEIIVGESAGQTVTGNGGKVTGIDIYRGNQTPNITRDPAGADANAYQIINGFGSQPVIVPITIAKLAGVAGCDNHRATSARP